MADTFTTSAAPGRLLTSAQVAERLAISIRTLWRMVERGCLPQPQRYSSLRLRWKEADIDAWLARPTWEVPETGCFYCVCPACQRALCHDHCCHLHRRAL